MTPDSTTTPHYPDTVDELLAFEHEPVVDISQQGLFTYVNKQFEERYGWQAEELIDQDVTRIMPPHLRDAHKVGLSRFITTEKATLLGTRLPLAILHKDGTIAPAEHYILGDKKHGEWRFAAIINPNHQ